MNPSRTYLLRVLQRLESRLGSERWTAEAASIGQLADRLSKADSIQEELDTLLRTEGMEQLAVGLMWLSSQEMPPSNGLLGEVVDHQVEMLRRILLADPDEEVEERRPVSPRNGGVSLNTALIEFSRHIADLRRRLSGGGKFQGFSEEAAWRILDQLAVLRETARSTQNLDVPRFCDALGEFLEYVVAQRIFADIRVLGVIDAANRTLQTVVAGEIPEERQSLEQTIALLKHPSTFFRN